MDDNLTPLVLLLMDPHVIIHGAYLSAIFFFPEAHPTHAVLPCSRCPSRSSWLARRRAGSRTPSLARHQVDRPPLAPPSTPRPTSGRRQLLRLPCAARRCTTPAPAAAQARLHRPLAIHPLLYRLPASARPHSPATAAAPPPEPAPAAPRLRLHTRRPRPASACTGACRGRTSARPSAGRGLASTRAGRGLPTPAPTPASPSAHARPSAGQSQRQRARSRTVLRRC
jgi:hypothetical protein